MTEQMNLVLKIAVAAMVLGAGAWLAARIATGGDRRKVIKVCRKCSALNHQDLEQFAEERMQSEGGVPKALIEIKKLFELFIQSETEYQRQFCSGIELTGLDGADRVSGDADHLGEIGLGELFFLSGFFEAVFELDCVFHGLPQTVGHMIDQPSEAEDQSADHADKLGF